MLVTVTFGQTISPAVAKLLLVKIAAAESESIVAKAVVVETRALEVAMAVMVALMVLVEDMEVAERIREADEVGWGMEEAEVRVAVVEKEEEEVVVVAKVGVMVELGVVEGEEEGEMAMVMGEDKGMEASRELMVEVEM
eukprot:gene18973-22678_t